MELNRVVFPRPTSSYTFESMGDKLIFIPKFQMQNAKANKEWQLDQMEILNSLSQNRYNQTGNHFSFQQQSQGLNVKNIKNSDINDQTYSPKKNVNFRSTAIAPQHLNFKSQQFDNFSPRRKDLQLSQDPYQFNTLRQTLQQPSLQFTQKTFHQSKGSTNTTTNAHFVLGQSQNFGFGLKQQAMKENNSLINTQQFHNLSPMALSQTSGYVNPMRASQPYTFQPKNGAPSMRGKIIQKMSNKLRDSVSLNGLDEEGFTSRRISGQFQNLDFCPPSHFSSQKIDQSPQSYIDKLYPSSTRFNSQKQGFKINGELGQQQQKIVQDFSLYENIKSQSQYRIQEKESDEIIEDQNYDNNKHGLKKQEGLEIQYDRERYGLSTGRQPSSKFNNKMYQSMNLYPHSTKKDHSRFQSAAGRMTLKEASVNLYSNLMESQHANNIQNFLEKFNNPSNIDYKVVAKKKPGDFIPCIVMKYPRGASKIFLYFHANAEDLGKALKFLTYVNIYLRMHVIAVEYPGYGVYEGDNSNAEKIIQDADVVYNFILKQLYWKEQDIIVCGRSIGSGPACYLASHYKPACLVLISPHTSIRGIVKDLMFGSIAQHLIAERFRNIEAIAKVVCPTFILHGIRDSLVSYHHSQQLCDTCGGPSFLLLPENMDHNNLDVIGDFIAPLSEFLDNFSISTNNRHIKSRIGNRNQSVDKQKNQKDINQPANQQNDNYSGLDVTEDMQVNERDSESNHSDEVEESDEEFLIEKSDKTILHMNLNSNLNKVNSGLLLRSQDIKSLMSNNGDDEEGAKRTFQRAEKKNIDDSQFLGQVTDDEITPDKINSQKYFINSKQAETHQSTNRLHPALNLDVKANLISSRAKQIEMKDLLTTEENNDMFTTINNKERAVSLSLKPFKNKIGKSKSNAPKIIGKSIDFARDLKQNSLLANVYRGPNLIIDATYHERPRQLIERSKQQIKQIEELIAISNFQQQRKNSKFTIFKNKNVNPLYQSQQIHF